MNYNDDTRKNPASSSSFQKVTTKIQLWLYFSCFIDLFGASLIIPVFGTHLRSLGFGHTLVGVLGSVYAGTQFLSGPILGSWSDSYGRRPTLFVILFTCSISYLLLGVVRSFYGILLLRLLLGCVKHTQTICKTLVADAVAVERQAETHARLSAFASLGFTVGPIIAGHVSEFENGFFYLCIITSSFFFINGLTVFWFFPDCKQSHSYRHENELRKNLLKNDNKNEQTENLGMSIKYVSQNEQIENLDTNKIIVEKDKNIKNSDTLLNLSVLKIIKDLSCVEWNKFWDVFAFKFIQSTSLSLFFNNYYLFAETMYGVSSKHIGYLISVQSLAAALLGTQIRHFHRMYPSSTSYTCKISHCFVVLTLSLSGILIAPEVWTYTGFLILLNGCTALLRTLTTELLLFRTDAEHRGSLMGAGNSVNSSARFIAPLMAGVIQEHCGTLQVVVTSAVVSLLGTILSMCIDKYSQTSEKKEV